MSRTIIIVGDINPFITYKKMNANNEQKCFLEAISWIRSNDGFIHKSLTLSTTFNKYNDNNHDNKNIISNEGKSETILLTLPPKQKRTRTCTQTFEMKSNQPSSKAKAKAKAKAKTKEERGQIMVINDIAKNDILMKIPRHCLITLESIKKSDIGKFIFDSLSSYLDRSCNNDDKVVRLYHDRNDLIMAMYLSFLFMISNKKLNSMSKKRGFESIEKSLVSINTEIHGSAIKKKKKKKEEEEEEEKDAIKEKKENTNDYFQFYLPYIHTLPDAYDHVPRRWTGNELNRILGGTSLLSRVLLDKQGVIDDYNHICHSLKVSVKKTSDSKVGQMSFKNSFECPTFDLFDTCLAAVASRAFAGFGNDFIQSNPSTLLQGKQTQHIQIYSNNNNNNNNNNDDNKDAMVPILDLLNHKRDNKEKPEVQYECDNEGNVIVIARKHLQKGTIINDTYGAKGNAQLLNRYGFCLPSNIEPDGSSNDVLELDIQHHLLGVTTLLKSSKIKQQPKIDEQKENEFCAHHSNSSMNVYLRTGPKSYTFGGFVKALEICRCYICDYEDQQEKMSISYSDDELEAFLDECDEDDNSEQDFNDFYTVTNKNDGKTYHQNNHDNTNDISSSQSNDIPSNTNTLLSTTLSSNDKEKLKSIHLECKALSKFAETLKHAMLQYPSVFNDVNESERFHEKEIYAAMLIRSEKRTIFFYLQTIDLILNDLQNYLLHNHNFMFECDNTIKGYDDSQFQSIYERNYGDDDRKRLSLQSKELREVFFKIRYPQIFSQIKS